MFTVSAAVPRLDVRVLLCDVPPTRDSILQFARRENFAAAVQSLNRIAVPTPHLCHIQTLHLHFSIDVALSRSATGFNFRKPSKDGTAHRVTLESAIAALANPAKRLAAERLLAAFGFLQTAAGVRHVAACTVQEPGYWPRQKRARAAVLLWLIVAARRNELPRELHLVAPP